MAGGRFGLLGVAVIFLLLASCQSPQDRVTAYVLKNQARLTELCEQWCAAGEMVPEENVDEAQQIRLYPERQLVVFECFADGIMTSSVQGGFYYSGQDEIVKYLVGWAPGDGEPTVTGSRREWRSSGDDYYFVVPITGHFYYFQAGN